MATTSLLIPRLFEIIDAEQWALLRDVFAADAVYDRPGYPQLHGIKELESFYRRARAVSGTHVLFKVLTDKEAGCCWGRFNGTTRDNHEVVVEYFADWYGFCDDLIGYRRTFFYRPAV